MPMIKGIKKNVPQTVTSNLWGGHGIEGWDERLKEKEVYISCCFLKTSMILNTFL